MGSVDNCTPRLTGCKSNLDKLSLETSCSFPLFEGHQALEEILDPGWIHRCLEDFSVSQAPGQVVE